MIYDTMMVMSKMKPDLKETLLYLNQAIDESTYPENFKDMLKQMNTFSIYTHQMLDILAAKKSFETDINTRYDLIDQGRIFQKALRIFINQLEDENIRDERIMENNRRSKQSTPVEK